MAGVAAVPQERQNLTPKKLCVSLGSLLGSGFHPSVEEIQGEKEGQEQSMGPPISGESGIHTVVYLLLRHSWGENARMNCIHNYIE